MKVFKFTVLIIALCVFSFSLISCSSIESKNHKTKKDNKPTNSKQKEIKTTPGLDKCKNFKEAGKKMIKSIVKGLEEKNYALYTRDFTKQNKKFFNKKVFNEASNAVNTKLGDYKRREFLGSWHKGDYNILLWKVKFSKTKDDILIKLYLKKVEDSYKVAAAKLK